jgi:CBS-domain-containing membrane protein
LSNVLTHQTSAAAVAELRVRLCDTDDLVSKPVFCVRDCARTIDVLRELTQRTLSSVPLLDERGEWVATFSISDLKVFVHHLRIEHLELPIVTLLGMVRQQNDKHARCQTMAVPWSATLGEVIAKLAATQVHRMFVRDVDSTGAPTGCVSLTDLLEHLVVPELVSSKA